MWRSVRPLDGARNPFELYLLILGLAAGIPLLWGSPAPGSAAELLGPVWVHVWAYILVGGCLTALVGVFWPWCGWLGRKWPRIQPQIGTGLLIEQVGMVAVGVGTVIYSIAIFTAAVPGGRVAAAMSLGYGLACLARGRQIQFWVKAAIAERER